MDPFIKVEAAVRFDLVMPVDHCIDRSEFSDSAFHLTEESLDLAVGLRMIHPRCDMPDTVIVKESAERMVRGLGMPAGDEL